MRVNEERQLVGQVLINGVTTKVGNGTALIAVAERFRD